MSTRARAVEAALVGKKLDAAVTKASTQGTSRQLGLIGSIPVLIPFVIVSALALMPHFGVVLMSVLAGVGTAGVPGGSLPLIVLVLRSVDVPGEGIAIILGIDRILDMCRTVLNVAGDLVLASCVAQGEPGQSGQSIGPEPSNV